jgi:hypothetical protein
MGDTIPRWPIAILLRWGGDILVALTLLPLVSLALLYLLFLPLPGTTTANPRRLALLYASLAWGMLLAISTEALSLFSALTRPAVAAFWAGAVLLLAAAVAARRRPWTDGLSQSARGVDPVIWSCLAGCAVVVAVTAYIALAAAPNTWDSMTYHLTRVMHWQQDRSLDFYATNIQRQLHLTPGAEFVTLHLQLLSGGDRLANLPQWLAFMGSLLLVSLTAARLGATARGQAFATLFCATLPMGILQSTSTQNDLVLAYWLVCLAALVTDAAPGGWPWMLALGAALGLATLTKATAFVFALPFLVWLAVRLRARPARLAAVAVVSGLLLIGVNGGQFARNHELYGSPFGPDGEGDRQEVKYLNGYFSGPEVASNVLRNATLQVSTPVSGVNRLIERTVVAAHRELGIDPSDPQTTYGLTRFSVRQTSNGEDTAGNPLHFTLLVGTAIVVVASRRYRRSPLLPYLLCLVTGFLVFSLLLRWQPWNSRLMLPLFVLGSGIAGSVLGDVPRRLPMAALAIGLTFAATPWLVANRSRPLVASAALETSPSILTTSRTDQYFAKRPALEAPYRSAAALITAHGARRVGLICHEDAWEYPLWILLGSAWRSTPVIEHTAVHNVSARLGSPDPDAFDTIVCLDCQPGVRDRLEGEGFRPALDDRPVTVLFAPGGGGPGS